MAFSYTRKDYPQGADALAVPFPYTDKSHVKVLIDEQETTAFKWSSDTSLKLDTPLAAPAQVLVKRETPIVTRAVDFEASNGLTEQDLDDANIQLFYALQEAADEAEATYIDHDVDMTQHRLFNLKMSTPPIDHEAATVGFVREQAGSLAAGYASTASDAATRATTAEDTVKQMYHSFFVHYRGSGDTLPNAGLQDGALFYYQGPKFSEGFYRYSVSYNEPDTGRWKHVSGVGPAGPTGPQGPEGPEGIQGIQGERGERGLQGQQGLQGPQGFQGERGPIGQTGATGPQGVQGEVGPQGDQGVRGEQGIQGIQGKQGIQGDRGPKGDTGDVGPQGVQGEQGEQGAVGPTGPKGDTGDDGRSFQVDAFGTLAERTAYDGEAKNFTFYATDYQVRKDEMPRFDKFDGTGAQTVFPLSFTPDGPQSLLVYIDNVIQAPDTYSFDIDATGDVYKLAFKAAPATGTGNIMVRESSLATGYGAIYMKNSATVGDWSNPIPFGKGPRGDQGPQGVQGAVGPTGPQGKAGPQGAAGPQGVEGPEGPKGPQGDAGPQGAIGPKGEQGLAGPQGLKGPQGATGDAGPEGPQGPQGEMGPKGIQGPEGPVGPVGPQGKQGITGRTGPQGAIGPTGPKGPRGDAGPVGPTGPKGAAGNKGPTGAAGRSVEARVYPLGKSKLTALNRKDSTIPLFTVKITKAASYEREALIGPFPMHMQVTNDAYFNKYSSWLFTTSSNKALAYTPPKVSVPKPLVENAFVHGLILKIPAGVTGTFTVNWGYNYWTSMTGGAAGGVGSIKGFVQLYGDGHVGTSAAALVRLHAAGTSLG